MVYEEIRVAIDHDADVVSARQKGRALAAQIGFSGSDLTLIATALKNAGSSIDHVYRTRMFLTHVEDWETVGRVHGKFFSLIRPAATMVVIKQLLDPRWRIEIEADAYIPD